MPNPKQIAFMRFGLVHRILTARAVSAALLPFDEDSLLIAKELLDELVSLKFLRSYQLTGNEDYYTLQPRAAEALRVEKVQSGPLKRRELLHHYASLYYCCLDSRHCRMKIDSETFRDRFPRLYLPGPLHNYVTSGATLSYVRVDAGKDGPRDAQRLIDAAYRDIQKRVAPKSGILKEFDELVQAGRFEIVVLTCFETKVAQVQDACNRLAEKYYAYRDVRNQRSAGETVPPDNYREYRAAQAKDQPPRLPPPLKIIAVPELFEIMYSPNA